MMKARHAIIISEAFQNPERADKKKLWASLIISSILVALSAIFFYCINSSSDDKQRTRTLENLVIKIDGILADAIESATALIKTGTDCTSQQLQSIKKTVQTNGYIRSLTLFDASGNIYCSSSTGQTYIPNERVNLNIRHDIRKRIEQNEKGISIKLISGSNRVPDKNAMVILIPFNNGIMTLAIDAGYFTTPLSTIHLVSNKIYTLEADGMRLSWHGLTASSSVEENGYLKKSTLFPYKIIETSSENTDDIDHTIISAGFFSSLFLAFFLTSRWTLNRFYSRKRYIINALRDKAFSFDIQPVFSLNEKRLMGGEVLIRWRVSPSIMISPHLFIPVAEKHNIVNKLAEFLLTDIADRILAGSLILPPSFRLNFNVHSSHFEQESLIIACQYFLNATAACKIKLVLELTERQELAQQMSVKTTLSVLIAAGVEMAVDDFGTGSSGLRYLYNSNFRCIKIDKSLTEEAISNPLACTVMESSIQLAQKLGKVIVVEGIETQQQLELISRMDLKNEVLIQGYLWSRPLCPQQFGYFINHNA